MLWPPTLTARKKATYFIALIKLLKYYVEYDTKFSETYVLILISTKTTDMGSFQDSKKSSPKILKYVFYTGLLAGTLDISASFVNFLITSGGKNPVIVLYFIASGVFGQIAYLGGSFYAICGLLFHFIIVYSFVTFYFFNYPKVKTFLKNKYWIAILFGILTWLIMNLIVIPLSHTPSNPHSVFQLILHIVFLILFIGLPAALSSDMFIKE